MLSNDMIGVNFNDATKIIIDKANSDQVCYVHQGPQNSKEKMEIYHLTDYPPELKKKITLFQHFQKFFIGRKGRPQKDQGKNINDKFLTEDL